MDSADHPQRQHDLLALHRYYLWANRFRTLFEAAPPGQAGTALTTDMAFDDDAVMFMSFWFSGIYAVIEGWHKLVLADPRIDELLESRHVTLLRRFRNDICHFQREHGDPQCLDIVGSREIVPWVRELTLGFGNYFLDAIPPDAA